MEIEQIPTDSPRVKFHWCRSVRCLNKKVLLVLTTLSGTEICLEWKSGSGWFESDFVSLSPGLYTGYISISSKKKSGLFEPVDEEVIEHQYNIDPFFVSPQKFSIELFIQTKNVQGIWQEVVGSIKRHAISQPLVSQREPQEEPKTKWFSSFELGRGIDYTKKKEEFEYHQSSPDISFNNSSQSKTDINLVVSCSSTSQDLDLDERNQSACKEVIGSLQRWSSIGNKGTDDLTLVSTDLSFQLEQDRDSENIQEQFVLPAFTSVLKEESNDIKESLSENKNQYFFKELDPVEGVSDEGNYGCVITFESRSTSIDDIGSPRHLENVLVSLSSNDTDNRNSASFHIFNPSGGICDIVEAEATNQISPEKPFRLSIHGSTETNDSDSKYPESDLTINEDENFVYDSLKNDGHEIPLNIQDLSCNEESLEYQQPPPKPKRTLQESSQVDSVVQYRTVPTQEVLTDQSFILVHPGSLRSESGSNKVQSEANSNKVTLSCSSDKDQTPSEIELFEAVETVRKLSNAIQPLIVISSEKLGNREINSKTGFDRPIMSSTGTQTSFKDISNSIPKTSYSSYNRRLKKEQIQLSDDSYSPLPCKVQGPWQRPKYRAPKDKSHPSAKSILKNFKKNFQNLEKAERIIRNYSTVSQNPNRYETHPVHRDLCVNHSRSIPKDLSSSDDRIITSSSYSSPLLRPAYYSSQNQLHPKLHYERPTKVKEVPSPILSIYGHDICRRQHMPYTSSRPTRYSRESRGIIQPTFSLPNLRECILSESPTLTVSQNYRLRSSENNIGQANRRHKNKYFKSIEHSKRRRHKSYEPPKHLRDTSSSGESTECLLEEAYGLRKNFRNASNGGKDGYSRQKLEVRTTSEFPIKNYVRVRSKSCSRDSSVCDNDSAFAIRRRSLFVPSGEMEEVAQNLRARSETDLRMIGNFSGGYKSTRPYLPYEQEQLFAGQVVKVLVPGSGVAMARVVYAPAGNQTIVDNNISVLLISEPSNMCGSVISVPMSKILLAWPKHNKENIIFT